MVGLGKQVSFLHEDITLFRNSISSITLTSISHPSLSTKGRKFLWLAGVCFFSKLSFNSKLVSKEKVCFIDTAGQDDYDRLRPLSYPETDIFLVCYSVSDPSSFARIKSKWVPELRNFTGNTPFIVVGLKSDFRDVDVDVEEKEDELHIECIPFEEGEKMAREVGASTNYMECSSKKMQGLEEIIQEVFRIVHSEEFIPNPLAYANVKKAK